MKDSILVGIRRKKSEDKEKGPFATQDLEIYDTKTGRQIRQVIRASMDFNVDEVAQIDMTVNLLDIDLPGLSVELEEMKFIDRRTGKKFKLAKIDDGNGIEKMTTMVSDNIKNKE